MVSSSATESENIELVLSVDKASLERQLKDVFGQSELKTPAQASAGGGKQRLSFLSPEEKRQLTEFRDVKRAKAEQTELGQFQEELKPTSGESGGKGVPVQPGAGFVKHLKHLAVLVGIPLGLAALLKMSKLAAGTLGALQSIMGAMVDSFLAPFMPKIAEGISWLAEKGIPASVSAGERTLEAIKTTGTAMGFGNPTNSEQASAAGTVLVAVADALGQFAGVGLHGKKGLGSFWRDAFGGGPQTFEQTDLTHSQRGAFLGSQAYQQGSPQSNRQMLQSIREGRIGGSLSPTQMWPPVEVNLTVDAGSFEEITKRRKKEMNEAYDVRVAQAAHLIAEMP